MLELVKIEHVISTLNTKDINWQLIKEYFARFKILGELLLGRQMTTTEQKGVVG